ncbi:hypothetical protein D3C80_2174200 [compost metagenome]
MSRGGRAAWGSSSNCSSSLNSSCALAQSAISESMEKCRVSPLSLRLRRNSNNGH